MMARCTADQYKLSVYTLAPCAGHNIIIMQPTIFVHFASPSHLRPRPPILASLVSGPLFREEFVRLLE